MFATCWSNWLLRYYINNNHARCATATITSPAVASLASMLEKCRVLVRDRGEEGLSALPDPGAGVLCGHGPSLRVTAPHTVVCQADRRSRRRGGGWDRSDWNVVKEVLFVYWLIPTLAPPTRERFLDVTSWLRLKNFVVPELGQILL